MHLDLAASLTHVASRCRGAVDADLDGVAELARRIQAGDRVDATVFSRYHDLVQSILDDDLDQAARLLADLARDSGERGERRRIVALAQSGRPEAYGRILVAESGLDFALTSPDPETFGAWEARCRRALDLLRHAAPDLHAEIGALVREIVGVVSDASRPIAFDGGSCSQLWGALFLNAAAAHSDVGTAEVLAHESAHGLLFGLSRDDVLVENGEDELFASPLRADPRPMLGIYHAAFVSARMHYAMDALFNSGLLEDPAEREAAARARDTSRDNFVTGLEVVRRHGRLTPFGEAIINAASESVHGRSGAAIHLVG